MATSSEILDTIAENVTKPAEVSTDAGTVKQHNLQDQIAAQKHVASQGGAADGELFGLRVRKARFGRRRSGDSC